VQHLVLVRDLLDRQGHGARIGADDGLRLVVEDDRFRLARAHIGLGLVVAIDDLDRVLAEETAFGIDLCDCKRKAFDRVLDIIRRCRSKAAARRACTSCRLCAANRGVMVSTPALPSKMKSRRLSSSLSMNPSHFLSLCVMTLLLLMLSRHRYLPKRAAIRGKYTTRKPGWSVLGSSRQSGLRRGPANSNYDRGIVEHDYVEVKEWPRTSSFATSRNGPAP
jgi:hypothetical protein